MCRVYEDFHVRFFEYFMFLSYSLHCVRYLVHLSPVGNGYHQEEDKVKKEEVLCQRMRR